MKLKEQLSGTGDVFKDGTHLGKVNYNLYVYQEILHSDGEEIEGLTDTTGNIDSENALKFYNKKDLVLHLEDRRHIKFEVLNPISGEIACSGEFFQETNSE